MKAWRTSLFCLVLTGCASFFDATLGPWIVTSGSHSTLQQCLVRTPATYAVWSTRPIASQYVAGVILSNGNRVVERTRLEQLFAEQHFQLIHATEADLLRIGHMAGAVSMIFIDATTNPDSRYLEEGRGYTLTVTIRSVNVETGDLCMSGTASTPHQITGSLDESIRIWTYWAWMRAACPVEKGYRWVEPSRSERGGCKRPGQE